MTPYDEHIRLAQAMLHGHLYVDAPPWMEHINVNGHSYILHGPLSALICLPFVAVGIVDQRLICCLMGLVSALLCYKLTRSVALTAFFVFGTTFAYECANGASWDFALVATTPFTFAALYDRERTWFWAALAGLARYDLILAFPVYWWIRRDWRMLWGLMLWAAVYVWYAEARFGTLMDHSIAEWYWHYDTLRAQRPYGVFSLYYVPFNLYTLLFMAPAYVGVFPWIRPQFMGQSILSLSPALLTVRFSPWLMAAVLVSIPALTVYASGFSQLGCRYYVQVFPYLIMAMRKQKPVLIWPSVVSSVYFSLVAMIWGLA